VNMKTYPFPEAASTQAHWKSANGLLLLGHCRSCDRVHHYPRPICPRCGSAATDLTESKGRGRILSFTLSRMESSDAPIIHAFVTLDEGVSLLTRIRGASVEAVAIDARVEVIFVEGELGGAPQFAIATSQPDSP
jgi:uncharacterized protein